MSSKTFCPLPFIALTSDTMGHTRACCASTSNLLRGDGSPVNLGVDQMTNAFNSDGQKKVRQAMLHGEIPPQCAPCFEQEKYTQSSRQQALETWEHIRPELVAKRVEEARMNDGAIEDAPLFLDLRFGNKCNLECLSCNVSSSSRLSSRLSAIDPQDVLLAELAQVGDDKDKRYQWYLKDSFAAELKELIHPELLMINFAGGEPFILKQYESVLERCIELGLQKQLEVRVVTNGTSNNPAFIKLLSQFERVLLIYSLDAFRAGNDYLRPPSKWAQIERNWLEVMELPSNFHPYVNCVIQPFNLLELSDLLYFLAINDPQHRVYFNPLYSTNEPWLDPRVLPKEIRTLVRTQLDNLIVLCQEKGYFNEHSREAIAKLGEYIVTDEYDEQERLRRMKLFYSRAYKNDQLHQRDWKIIFPKLRYLLARAGE